MKKNFNKIASLVLAAAMVAATPGMVFAHTITVENSANDTATHTYAAYQIFKGDLSDGKLSNVVWGSGIDQAKLGTAAKDIASALSISEADAVDAVKVSEALSGKADDSDVAQNFADAISEALGTTTSGTPKSNTIEGLDDGYYFVEDTTELSTVQSAKTRFILQVVGGNLTVKAKANVPTSMKKVDENNNDVKDQVDSRISDVTLTDKYNDVADYSIGDTIPYELVGTLPDNYDKYETYTYEFTDTMSDGLTYLNDARVYLDSEAYDITDHFTITPTGETAGATLVITEKDAKGLKDIKTVNKDSKIIVKYTAKLNNNAKVGLPGNPNTMTLKFSNNPNKGGEGDTGTTPEDKNIVFTYGLDVNKYFDAVDAAKKLDGAKFVVLNSENKVLKVAEDGKITWVTAPDVSTLTVNSDAVVSAYTKAGATVLTSTDGKISVRGLDEGTYTAKEIQAPNGYNLASDTEIQIEATTANVQNWDGSAATALTEFKYTVANETHTQDGNEVAIDGVAQADVIDKTGSTLPSTGGMGTTILYVAGAILVIAGAAVLVIKKRHEA